MTNPQKGLFITALSLIILSFSAFSAPNSTPQVGGNLEPIRDWSRTNVFVDVMQQARQFGTYDKAYGEPWVFTDAEGWPTTDFGVYLMTDIKSVQGLTGTYKLSFTGQAKVSASIAKITVENLHYDAATSQTTADVIVQEGAPEFVLKFKDTGGSVKHIKLIRPGYTEKDLFTRPFLEHILRFPTLRFMDWMNTNGQKSVNWEDRSKLQDPSYSTEKGVPWEVIIHLANLTKKNIWINIPVLATDDYVKNLAQLLKQTLDPKLAIYVEFSNEVWNSQFPQFQLNVEAAKQETATNKSSTLNRDGQKNVYALASRRTARRLKEIAEDFATVFGPNCISQGTIRPVLAGQFANLFPLKESLEYIKKVFHDPKKYYYGISGALYLGTKAVDARDPAASPDQILEALNAELDKAKATLLKAEELSREFRLPFVGYEGGIDTFGNMNIQAKKAASNDPRMKVLVMNFLTQWFKAGLGEVMWFSVGASNWDGQYGTWGLTDDMTRQDTAKILGIDEFMKPYAPKMSFPARGSIGTPSPGATR